MIDGSVGFCVLVWFLIVMRSLIFCGSSFCFEWILPRGMLCLSALSMMFVMMLFAMCGFVGGVAFWSAFSISSVKVFQSAL